MSSKNTIQLAEPLFLSHQGEVQCGVTSLFIRVSGCNNMCARCDTKFSWDKNSGQTREIDEVADEVNQYYQQLIAKPFSNKKLMIVFTGGEPLLSQPELNRLIIAIKDKIGRGVDDVTFAMETSGNVSIQHSNLIAQLDIINLCPKSPCLEATTVASVKCVQQIIDRMQISRKVKVNLKFVVRDQRDVDFIEVMLSKLTLDNIDKRLHNNIEVWLMPFTEIQDGETDNKGAIINQSVKTFVSNVAQNYGWNVTTRLHIDNQFQ